MTAKDFPATVLISLGALGLIAFFGVLSAASGLGHWYRFGEEQLPFNLLGRAIMYGVVPMLAFIDIFRRKSSGRYLAILSLMCSSAVTFHLFFDLLGLPVNVRSGTAIFVMPILGIGILLATLALAMGLHQKVTAFFDSSRDDSSSHSSNILKAITGLDERLLPRKAESSLEEQIFEDLAFRVGNPLPIDVVMGSILVVLLLEATRRAMGWPRSTARVVLGIALERLADHYRLK